jgi:hypothetical protein
MLKTGYVLVFESITEPERYPSALIHRTREDAERALQGGQFVGRFLCISEITWDDTKALGTWP